jgi:hypothetical protein
MLDDFKPTPSFFINCGVVNKVWKKFFPEKYSVSYELFKQSFEVVFGDSVFTNQKSAMLQALICQNKERLTNYEPFMNMHLYDLINITDFIEFNELLNLSEVDNFAMGMHKLIRERELSFNFGDREIEM